MSDEEVQAMVAKWQAQQVDLIYCAATHQKLRLSQCQKYQDTWIHIMPPNKDRGERKAHVNPKFFCCRDSNCPHYKERKTPRRINRRLRASFRLVKKTPKRSKKVRVEVNE